MLVVALVVFSAVSSAVASGVASGVAMFPILADCEAVSRTVKECPMKLMGSGVSSGVL